MKVPLNSWPCSLQMLGVALMDLAQRIADHARRIEHVGCARKMRVGCIGSPSGGSCSRLTTAWVMREIARRHQHQHAVVGALEGGHFAKGVDLIDAGVGPRIGQHHEPGVDQQADAVSHARNSTRRLLLLLGRLAPPARWLPFSRRRRPGARRAPAPRPGSRGRPRGGSRCAPRGAGG